MNRWSVRIIGVLLLLLFMFLFINLKKQLTTMQQSHGNAPAQAPSQ
jgi:hypothetical protein